MANTSVTEKVVKFVESILTEDAPELCAEKDCKHEGDCEERGTLCIKVIMECIKK